MALLLAFAATSILCPAAQAARHHPGGRLVVRVTGLPKGAPAKIVVEGAQGFRRSITRPESIAGLPPGAYRVRVDPVILRRAYRELPAESEAFPTRRKFRVRLGEGEKTVAAATYGTIRSAAVGTLGGPVLAVVGDHSSPRGIVLARHAADPFGVGSIIAQAPNSTLPRGLFARVIGKRSRGGRVTLSLVPASLWEAFPALDLKATVPLAESVVPEGAAGASDLSAIDLSVASGIIQHKLEASCGASPGGWSVAPSGSLRPSLTVDIHRRYLVVPYGEIALGVKGGLGLGVTIPKGAHCGFTVPGPGLEGVVPVAGVPVPVEGGLDLSLSLQSTGPISTSEKLGLDATGGMTFDGTATKPVADFKPTASGTFSGSGGEVDLEPELQVGIGALDGNAHVGVSPGLAFKGTGSGCEIDLEGSVGAGIDVGAFHAKVDSPPISKRLYACPPRAAGGTPPPPPGASPGGGSTTGTWTIESVPVPPGGRSGLGGVSCPTGGLCIAVGQNEAEALIERRSGGSWSIEPGATVPGAVSVGLNRISCISASSCTAVGSQRSTQGGFGETPLIEHWDGLGWSVEPSPPGPGETSDLIDISCVDEAWCTAVGQTEFDGGGFNGGETEGFVEHWDGSSWTLESLPVPEGSDERSLAGVACASRALCEVVGGYDNDEGIYTGHAYADGWDGSAWTLQSVLGPGASQFSGLAGVDCVAGGYCAAVGYYDDGIGSTVEPMAVGLVGGTWGDQPIPTPAPPGSGGETPAVTCTSETSCLAVGGGGDEAGTEALVDHWDGSGWSRQATPPVPGALYSDLGGVSCPAVSSCVAVGDSEGTATGPEVPLVEVYSGQG